jgi:5-methylcytosine-specific restriction endonuclease McrA
MSLDPANGEYREPVPSLPGEAEPPEPVLSEAKGRGSGGVPQIHLPSWEGTLPTHRIDSPKALTRTLRQLRLNRGKQKRKVLNRGRRSRLTREERQAVLAKTGGLCHICGGSLNGLSWQADHVRPRSSGGVHAADNYLPAHSLCNTYRWDHLAEEFQWVLKIGVWARHEIESETPLGLELARRFVAHEKVRQRRRQSGGKRA